MPRKSRIDAPGALHHIIARGIERRPIFRDDRDRDDFLERLGTNLEETRTPCYAWALLPNHFHLLLRTGEAPISTVMRRVLTGYAVAYNRRHHRQGHLFQNRFKSILCQEDQYFMELVRYIHLNPLRSGLVEDLKSLEEYRYCGHSGLMGKWAKPWQDTEGVLVFFAKRVSSARAQYREFMTGGDPRERRPDLVGGGLIRSVGGWEAMKSSRETGAYQKGDERILGDGTFVEDVLVRAKEIFEQKYRLKAQGLNLERVLERVAEVTGLERTKVLAPGKYREIGLARSLLCYWAVRELGISQMQLARMFRISQPAVSMAVRRGEALAEKKGFSILG